MTAILAKLEADFAALEQKLANEAKTKEVMGYDKVLPVVEKMQHPLGECRMAQRAVHVLFTLVRSACLS
jgi:hypothetical protein